MPKNSKVKYYIWLLKYLQKFSIFMAKTKEKKEKFFSYPSAFYFPDWFPQSHQKIKNLFAVQPINE